MPENMTKAIIDSYNDGWRDGYEEGLKDGIAYQLDMKEMSK